MSWISVFLCGIALIAQAGVANARCEGVVMLAPVHDAYLATLTETGARESTASI